MKKKLIGKLIINFSVDLDDDDDVEKMKSKVKNELLYNGTLDDVQLDLEDLLIDNKLSCWNKEVSITVEEK